MKKSVFLLVTVLMSNFSYSQIFDTIFFTNGYADTINKTYIFPEVMNESVCFDQGANDPIIEPYEHNYISRLTCDNRALKSVAQGFMFEDTTNVEGVFAYIGYERYYDSPITHYLGFKMGVMDEQYNIIYSNDIIFDVSAYIYQSYQIGVSFMHLPFDSTLRLCDFKYIFIEWPDSTCEGGTFWPANSITPNTYLYSDDNIRLFLLAFREEMNPAVSPGGIWNEEMCVACDVKYEPLFKWYGSNYWESLHSMRCDMPGDYGYGYTKDGVTCFGTYYPPIGLAFYYNNSENNDNALSDIDVSHLVSVHPNPAKDIVTVQSSFKVREIEIINTLGQVVLRKEGNQNIETLEVNSLEKGTYIVRIKTQRGFANKKLVIK
ncbi:MAG: T9SS type A sorting domain-containing protein [Bacteroidales bacterium]|nr:T9SS type A sorting domain-containing protein [Bacteroidales bacterium]